MYKGAKSGDLGLVEFHIKMGIDPNYQHPEFMAAALVESIRQGHLDIARFLLENGADPEIKEDWGGDTPLSVARTKGNQAAVDLIQQYIKA